MLRNIGFRLRTRTACTARIRPETSSSSWRGLVTSGSIGSAARPSDSPASEGKPFARKRVDRRYVISETRKVPPHIVRPPVSENESLLLYFRSQLRISSFSSCKHASYRVRTILNISHTHDTLIKNRTIVRRIRQSPVIFFSGESPAP